MTSLDESDTRFRSDYLIPNPFKFDLFSFVSKTCPKSYSNDNQKYSQENATRFTQLNRGSFVDSIKIDWVTTSCAQHELVEFEPVSLQCNRARDDDDVDEFRCYLAQDLLSREPNL